MDIVVDKDFPGINYRKWDKIWEWDLQDLKVWSQYDIDVPVYARRVDDPDIANVLIGAVVISYDAMKRVEVFRGIPYYVRAGKMSLPAQTKKSSLMRWVDDY